MNKSAKITEALILAGGLGTRLRQVIGEFPKPLAPINGVPFLQFLLDYCAREGITSVVLSVGYKWELIQEAFGDKYKNITLIYSVEDSPLGTGGAIRLGLEKIKEENCFVLNGDTIFDIPLQPLANSHLEKKSTCTLALKQLEKIDRYGTIEINLEQRITAFKEKGYAEKALINGGIYCLQKNALDAFPLGHTFSFENDFLSETKADNTLYGIPFDHYFKDIGIPEDYNQFEKDIRNKTLEINA